MIYIKVTKLVFIEPRIRQKEIYIQENNTPRDK